MNDRLRFVRDEDRAVEIYHADALLLRYVYRPETPVNESPRPFAHPVRTLKGSVLTGFRPNDHPWHHGLSFTINHVSETNFWGGPSYRTGDGYQWRKDHGTQSHQEWLEFSADKLVQRLHWVAGESRDLLLNEFRALKIDVVSQNEWSLRWSARLINVTRSKIALGNYHSRHGLMGSHYTGLQFRGARDLLDEHGDKAIVITAENELSGESAVHGAEARWMEWLAQKDETLDRVKIRFTNNTGKLHWFVRRQNPLAAFPFQFDRDHIIEPEEELIIDHTLTFTDIS